MSELKDNLSIINANNGIVLVNTFFIYNNKKYVTRNQYKPGTFLQEEFLKEANKAMKLKIAEVKDEIRPKQVTKVSPRHHKSNKERS